MQGFPRGQDAGTFVGKEGRFRVSEELKGVGAPVQGPCMVWLVGEELTKMHQGFCWLSRSDRVTSQGEGVDQAERAQVGQGPRWGGTAIPSELVQGGFGWSRQNMVEAA